MKTYYLIALLCVGLLLNACSSEEIDSIPGEPQVPEEPQSEMVSVSLNLGGEFEESEEPLTKVDGDKKVFYAVCVDTLHITQYEMKGVVVTDTTYCNYLEGLFDNVDNLKVELPLGRKYRFKSAVVKELNDRIYHEGNMYYGPFSSVNDGVELKNIFVVNTYSKFNIDNFFINVDQRYEYKINAEVDRYYGELNKYEPSSSSNIVNIALKRYSFGLKFIITPPKDGSITVSNSTSRFSYTVKSTDNTLETDNIYATATQSSYYKDKPNYAEHIYLNIVWVREDGSRESLEKTIDVKRNVKKIVRINLNNRDSESDFKLDLEEKMTDEIMDIR